MPRPRSPTAHDSEMRQCPLMLACTKNPSLLTLLFIICICVSEHRLLLPSSFLYLLKCLQLQLFKLAHKTSLIPPSISFTTDLLEILIFFFFVCLIVVVVNTCASPSSTFCTHSISLWVPPQYTVSLLSLYSLLFQCSVIISSTDVAVSWFKKTVSRWWQRMEQNKKSFLQLNCICCSFSFLVLFLCIYYLTVNARSDFFCRNWNWCGLLLFSGSNEIPTTRKKNERLIYQIIIVSGGGRVAK